MNRYETESSCLQHIYKKKYELKHVIKQLFSKTNLESHRPSGI